MKYLTCELVYHLESDGRESSEEMFITFTSRRWWFPFIKRRHVFSGFARSETVKTEDGKGHWVNMATREVVRAGTERKKVPVGTWVDCFNTEQTRHEWKIVSLYPGSLQEKLDKIYDRQYSRLVEVHKRKQAEKAEKAALIKLRPDVSESFEEWGDRFFNQWSDANEKYNSDNLVNPDHPDYLVKKEHPGKRPNVSKIGDEYQELVDEQWNYIEYWIKCFFVQPVEKAIKFLEVIEAEGKKQNSESCFSMMEAVKRLRDIIGNADKDKLKTTKGTVRCNHCGKEHEAWRTFCPSCWKEMRIYARQS